jgi:hypothetical protein
MHNFENSLIIMPALWEVDPGTTTWDETTGLLVYRHRSLTLADRAYGTVQCEGCGKVEADVKMYIGVPMHAVDLMEPALPMCEECLQSEYDAMQKNPWCITPYGDNNANPRGPMGAPRPQFLLDKEIF